MREIKFRAWSEFWGKMLDCSYDNQFNDCRFMPHGFGLGNPSLKVMQFTGIYDRKGNPVYEGDIINVYLIEEYPSEDDIEDEGKEWFDNRVKQAFVCKQKVEWNKEGGYFCEVDTGDFCHMLGDNDELIVEVIGNIYQNPELLEDK